jgi:1,4-dihydroxy-2-naphthoate octaprenyltransferase
MNKKTIPFLKKWIMAIRPSSLLLSSSSVIIGIAMAFGDGIGHWPSAICSLIGAWLLHILVNLVNDYGDLEKGADKKGDFDPMRGILVGVVSLEELKRAILFVIFLLIFPCLYLFARAGWPVLAIALLSIAAAIFYTAGKKPLGYMGLGDFLVAIFFGPVAVAGTYYVQTLEMNLVVVLAGVAPGLFAVGVLTINNIRDHARDKSVNKKTLVVRFGKDFGRQEYLFSLFVACLMPFVILGLTRQHALTLAAGAVFFFSFPILKIIFRDSEAQTMNAGLGMTVLFCFIYSLIFSAGWFF